MNTDNFAGSGNWTAERSDAGPSASEGSRQGWREQNTDKATCFIGRGEFFQQ
jgi:hypothetical protein